MQGKAINAVAKKTIKVLVVGNPANTNALIAMRNAPNINPAQFTAMTRLDHNRAMSQLAAQQKVTVNDITNVTIWGNHSSTQYPDLHHTKVKGKSVIGKLDKQWYEGTYIPAVQQRGAAVIAARGLSSAASAANAAIAHMRSWALGTAKGDWVSMGIHSTGNSYGIQDGLIYSFPCVCKGGQWKVVDGLKINDFSRARMQATEKELAEESAAVNHLLPPVNTKWAKKTAKKSSSKKPAAKKAAKKK